MLMCLNDLKEDWVLLQTGAAHSGNATLRRVRLNLLPLPHARDTTFPAQQTRMTTHLTRIKMESRTPACFLVPSCSRESPC